MTREAKMWTVRLIILSVLAGGFFFVKNVTDDFASYPTEAPLNEDSLKFNSEEWKKEREYYEEIRPYMLKDLMANVLVVGMDSTTVKNLLGETSGPHDNSLWDYRLGVYRAMEASYLQVEFDDNGKLRKVYVIDR